MLITHKRVGMLSIQDKFGFLWILSLYCNQGRLAPLLLLLLLSIRHGAEGGPPPPLCQALRPLQPGDAHGVTSCQRHACSNEDKILLAHWKHALACLIAHPPIWPWINPCSAFSRFVSDVEYTFNVVYLPTCSPFPPLGCGKQQPHGGSCSKLLFPIPGSQQAPTEAPHLPAPR